MLLLRILLLVVTVIDAAGLQSSANPALCNLPSSVLCKSPETSKACKVMEQCSKQKRAQTVAAPLVNFTLLYEYSVGGYFLEFPRLLSAVYQIGEIINLTLVPFGWCKEKPDGNHWNFTCRDGPWEVQGNIIHACAISILNGSRNAVPFIQCSYKNQDPVDGVLDCGRRIPALPVDAILACANSSMGNALEHQMALQTKGNWTFMPWAILDGFHNATIQDQAEQELVELICSRYKGPKPAACGPHSGRFDV